MLGWVQPAPSPSTWVNQIRFLTQSNLSFPCLFLHSPLSCFVFKTAPTSNETSSYFQFLQMLTWQGSLARGWGFGNKVSPTKQGQELKKNAEEDRRRAVEGWYGRVGEEESVVVLYWLNKAWGWGGVDLAARHSESSLQPQLYQLYWNALTRPRNVGPIYMIMKIVATRFMQLDTEKNNLASCYLDWCWNSNTLFHLETDWSFLNLLVSEADTQRI